LLAAMRASTPFQCARNSRCCCCCTCGVSGCHAVLAAALHLRNRCYGSCDSSGSSSGGHSPTCGSSCVGSSSGRRCTTACVVWRQRGRGAMWRR